MDRIASQYNFVPLPASGEPVLPEWAEQVSMDVPFRDGVCGHIDIELEAQSPLFIRGAQQQRGQVQEPYTDHAGRFAVPGTSLRGMLRSVIEIASFGKLGPVNDSTFGLRDLKTRHLYGDYMADIQRREDSNKNEPMTLVNAGWLSRELDPADPSQHVYKIYPCHFARVEYAALEQFARHETIKLPSFNPNDKQSAVRKYKQWGEHAWRFFTIPIRRLVSRGAVSARLKLKRLSDYGEHHASGVRHAGRFVFTGQPQNRQRGEKRKKHHDFFFYGSTGDAPLAVTRAQLESFELIHADGAEQHRDELNPNEEWGFWKKRLKTLNTLNASVSPEERLGASVPVFFIVDPQKGNEPPRLRSFGLAMMFRLAYDMSVHDVLAQSQKHHTSPDLAALMFGYAELNDKDKQGHAKSALRGRVAVGQASLVGDASKVAAPVKAVLSAPKPTFYPAYIRQGVKDGGAPETQMKGAGYRWVSYMRETKPRLRGWKRYLARNKWVERPRLPEKAGESVMTTFTPVKQGARFRFRLTVHNLREVELGALLWALDFGGSAGAAHALGMGRPLGYGRVRLKRVAHALYSNEDVFFEHPLAAERLTQSVDLFRGYMAHKTQGAWAGSETLRELCLCATPHPSGQDPEHIRHPEIAHPRNGNEFQDYKANGARLPLHGEDGAYAQLGRALKERETKAPWRPSEG
ncbi:MAG: TIGR03986 family CRISPR-associated RAMP protein [Deltaproteobacteria bacterium]|nr:TIGR03986 family CRISPR-associated RAMP protein [Deltaproteobacteria bacterium]